MNVIYSLSDLTDWVDIVANMQDREGWTPIIWLTTDKLVPQIKTKFPECKIQDYMGGNRGEFDSFLWEKPFDPLDKKTILEYMESEKVILKMMDRMDPTQRNFTYSQRVALYYDLLTYWTNIFKRHTIECVVFNEMPHFPLDYLLYCVAEKQGVKILRFSPTHVDSRIFLSGTLDKSPGYLDVYDTNMGLSEEIQTYMKKLEGDYSDAVPFYMKKVLNKSSIVKSMYRWSTQGSKYLFSPPDVALRSKYKFVSQMKLSGIYQGYYRILGNYYKKHLKKTYENLSKPVDLDKKYIYVPLHYQPEKTSTPEGGIFSDQYLIVSLLAKSVPKGWKIYVKEHASQFSTKLYGERGRNTDFYYDLIKLGNVELAPLDYQVFDLIDNAKAVATITGTSALEAVVRGKFALLFGYPWFQSCEGMIRVEDKQNVIDILEKIEQGITPSKSKVRDFFSSIEQNSIKGYTGGGETQSNAKLDREKNIENMTRLLQNYADRV